MTTVQTEVWENNSGGLILVRRSKQGKCHHATAWDLGQGYNDSTIPDDLIWLAHCPEEVDLPAIAVPAPAPQAADAPAQIAEYDGSTITLYTDRMGNAGREYAGIDGISRDLGL